MRRVVVTGLGLVTPLGGDVETSWKNILASKSGAGPITHFDASDQKCRIACEVKPADHEYGFDPSKRVDHKIQRQVDPFIVYGLDAAGQAIEDAGLTDMDEQTRLRAGVSIGSGIGGLPGIESESLVLHEKGPGRVSPHFVHGRLINLISGQVSIKYGLMGPNHAVVTACSTGAHSIGDAARMIRDDDADIMLAGGAEATICPIGIAGFAQARALSTQFNDQPEKASRPYDKDRDGFVMGEGSGVVVLEEYEHAKRRGAKIYAEVVGYGLSGDAYHVTAPHPEGSGGYRAMEMALRKSGLQPSDIDYINAHGTSTPLGDELELGAVRRLFGNAIGTVSMSSTKSAIGHLLGGAGAVESIFCILAMRDQIVPPTLNLDNPSEGTAGVDLVPHKAKERQVRAVLNNSFGFGGTNASLIMKAADYWSVTPAKAGAQRRRNWAPAFAGAHFETDPDRCGCARRRGAAGPLFPVVGAGTQARSARRDREGRDDAARRLAPARQGRSNSGKRQQLLRHGANLRLARSRPGRRVPHSQGHGRRVRPRPAAARQAGAAADHRHRRHAVHHCAGEARRDPLPHRRDAPDR
jgi:3-oxoacyl-[acyl-carrier-protein] synthase II